MAVTLARRDGLYVLAGATVPQLLADGLLAEFAAGLIPAALARTGLPAEPAWTLAGMLHHPDPQLYPLLVALLALDAEINAVIDDRRRVFPLPGFLTYRRRLGPDSFRPDTLRLPPLNPDGHYLLVDTDTGFCAALRLDLHPRLNVAGHVRLAISSPTREPQRLQAAEHRLDRQELTEDVIEAAIAAGSRELSTPLTGAEQASLRGALGDLVGNA